MSNGDRDAAAEGTGDEPFLARWSRLKAQARHPEPGPPPEPGALGNDQPPAAPTAMDAASPEGAPEPPVQLPDLEQLHEDSDYSAFLTPGVDAELKKRALRKLSHSPKFNVFDGLDTYRDDYFYLSFADLEPGVEWLDGELKGIDAEFHRGELPLTTIFGLIKLSEMVLTGPTWTTFPSVTTESVKRV